MNNCCQAENCLQTDIPIQFIIGDGGTYTPLNGGVVYDNPDIQAKNFLIMKNGVGVLFEGVHYQRMYNMGVQLIGGNEFLTGEQYTIIFY